MNITVLTEEFIIGSDFNAFIRRLRPKLAQSGHFTHHVPKLYPQENPPTRWCDVTLKDGNQSVTLRIRCCNVYLDGFRASDGTWWEFKPKENEEQHIPTSELLPFNSDYTELARKSKKSLGDVELGYQNLRHAILVLSGHKSSIKEHSSVAQSLIVVIMMVCETARNNIILNIVYGWMKTYQSKKLTEEDIAIIRKWEDLSAMLLMHDKDPTIELDINIKDSRLDTYDKLIAALGLVIIPKH